MTLRSPFFVRVVFPCLLLVFSLGLVLGAGEAFVRWQGTRDADGTFFFRGLPIRPYALPILKARTIVDRYLNRSNSVVVYDSDLGWRRRPNTLSADGSQRTNGDGLRADREYSASIPPGVMRISMFGDSFIEGADVGPADAPSVQLEAILEQRGIHAEVLNFGVGGYGFDQAYHHYRRDGSRYDTDVVVQGVQFENIGRNVTIFRIVAVPGTVIPFSKPRYVLRNGGMELINHPSVPPAEVPRILANFSNWPLAQYEASYADRYQRHWYDRSLLLRTSIDLWNIRNGAQTPRGSDLYDVDGEGMNITVRLLEAWRDEVTRDGGQFVLVYLPRAETIGAKLAGAPDPWQTHRDRLRGFTIADPSAAMVDFAREHGMPALIPAHYTPAGYRIVAEALAKVLVPLARNGAARPR